MPIIYGEGAYKPAASGAHSYKRADVTKFLQEENLSVFGPGEKKFGRQDLEKAKKISKQIRRKRESK